jgi:hypothetical protein
MGVGRGHEFCRLRLGVDDTGLKAAQKIHVSHGIGIPKRLAPGSGDQPAESSGPSSGRKITARDRKRYALEPYHGGQDRAGDGRVTGIW